MPKTDFFEFGASLAGTHKPTPVEEIAAGDIRAVVMRDGDVPHDTPVQSEQLLAYSQAAKILQSEIYDFAERYRKHFSREEEKVVRHGKEYVQSIDEVVRSIAAMREWLSHFIVNVAHDEFYLDYLTAKIDEKKHKIEKLDTQICAQLTQSANEKVLNVEAKSTYMQRAAQKLRITQTIRQAHDELQREAAPSQQTFRDSFGNDGEQPDMENTTPARLHAALNDSELAFAQQFMPDLCAEYSEIIVLYEASEQAYGARESEARATTEKIIALQVTLDEAKKDLQQWMTAKDEAERWCSSYSAVLQDAADSIKKVGGIDTTRSDFKAKKSPSISPLPRLAQTRFIKTKLTTVTEEDMHETAKDAYQALASGELEEVPTDVTESRYFESVKAIFGAYGALLDRYEHLKVEIVETTNMEVDELRAESLPHLTIFEGHIDKLTGPVGMKSVFAEKAILYDKLTKTIEAFSLRLAHQQEKIVNHERLMEKCNQAIIETSEKVRTLSLLIEEWEAQKDAMIAEYRATGERSNEQLVARASSGDTAALDQLLMESSAGNAGYVYTEPTEDSRYRELLKTLKEMSQLLKENQESIANLSAESVNLDTQLVMLVADKREIESEITALEQQLESVMTDETYMVFVNVFEAAKKMLAEVSAKFYEQNPLQYELLVANQPAVALDLSGMQSRRDELTELPVEAGSRRGRAKNIGTMAGKLIGRISADNQPKVIAE